MKTDDGISFEVTPLKHIRLLFRGCLSHLLLAQQSQWAKLNEKWLNVHRGETFMQNASLYPFFILEWFLRALKSPFRM